MVAVADEVAVAGSIVLGGTASGGMASGITALVAVGICRNSSGECCREKKRLSALQFSGLL